MNNLIFKLTIAGLCLLAHINPVDAKQETFFSCEKGFQYESKQDAARCIKQQKLTFRSPLKCHYKQNVRLNLRLMIDSEGVRDLCEVMPGQKAIATSKALQKPAKTTELKFAPLCPAGYQLKARRGKDACAKGNTEQIKPPTKKVSR